MRKLHRWSKRSIKHKLLSNLKADGGTFDSVEDIEKYMRTPKSEKEKQKRLKIEVQYCRDTSSFCQHQSSAKTWSLTSRISKWTLLTCSE